MKRPYDTTVSEKVCRQALARGPLIANNYGRGLHWKFGRRTFNSIVVARLIEAGHAVREGNIVRAA